ncbi:MAG: MarC family protein, partial [Vicinamibacterales bacterium]
MLEGLLAELVRTTLLDVAALFPIVNPVGNAPIFLTLTRGATPDTRLVLARRIAINGFILLVVSMLVGSYILAFFGISLPAVQIAGGLVLSATGWSLLTRSHDDTVTEDRAA